jgi:SAM-dependent methyltransferase
MEDWSAGYVTDIGYTFGYYPELNPLRMQLAFLTSGLVCPKVGTACELGFGQGVSANLHAAASLVEWHGTDFNPAQVGFARELAAASGARAALHDDSFAEFCTRADLPEFDYIGVHGIWSWISDANRDVLVEFVRRKLKVGGVLYVSYNTLPGWSAFAPMRHLMMEHTEVMGAQGDGTVPRIDAALEFADKLLATNPAYARANPQVAARIKKIREQSRAYVAHEYFNRDWHPMHFSTAARWLAPAKVEFGCSAHYTDHVDAINLSKEQREFLKSFPDPEFRESVRDFLINQQFRRDYWVKGARKMSAVDQGDALRKLRVVLTTHRPDVPLKFTGAAGEATMAEAVYGPILDALADHKPMTIAQLEAAVASKGISFGQLQQAVLVLAGAGQVAAAQDDGIVAKARHQTDKLNAHLMQKARGSGDVNFMASPVTGGGIPVARFNQLFLQQAGQAKKQPGDLARFVWQVLLEQGQRVMKDGKPLQSPEENLAELTALAKTFIQKQLPLLKALQVA